MRDKVIVTEGRKRIKEERIYLKVAALSSKVTREDSLICQKSGLKLNVGF